MIHDGYFPCCLEHTQHSALAGDSRRVLQELHRTHGHGYATPVASNGEASLTGEASLSTKLAVGIFRVCAQSSSKVSALRARCTYSILSRWCLPIPPVHLLPALPSYLLTYSSNVLRLSSWCTSWRCVLHQGAPEELEVLASPSKVWWAMIRRMYGGYRATDIFPRFQIPDEDTTKPRP